jgi:hypothetical protein
VFGELLLWLALYELRKPLPFVLQLEAAKKAVLELLGF